MGVRLKLRVTRCYLVEVVDKEGNEIVSDFTFCDRKDTKRIGERLMKEAAEKLKAEME